MAISYPIPDELKRLWQQGSTGLTGLLSSLLDPNQSSQPPEFQGLEGQRPQSIPGMLSNFLMPQDIKDSFIGGILNLMPGYIAANYRSPEAISALRRAMAEENKARGAMASGEGKTIWDTTNSPWPTDISPAYNEKMAQEMWQGRALNSSDLEKVNVGSQEALDQILRGSWFHGMRPEARGVIREVSNIPSQGDLAEKLYPYPNTFTDSGLDLWNKMLRKDRDLTKELPLRQVLDTGLPASTHATPSYTRFGEPYGVSITASPSIARNFSADDYIHRVQPLYGGPPTERIIPMWRPEGQKAMNEGYNTALNKWLGESQYAPLHQKDLAHLLEQNTQVNAMNDIPNNADLLKMLIERQFKPEVGNFNTLYSKALQDQGYRGILYSPQRYGEYEMLMLDPSYVRPLDYRKVSDYGKMASMGKNIAQIDTPLGTPGLTKGYLAAQPEFSTGATRLSDVFNQVPWVDRISEENKRRIAEMVNEKFREAVMNQLGM